ncbi:hypothetical protein [Hymenobacter rigui]|uniref:Uncharacterized protein n=1 Tax=Hymenobacter rigui TaxID=334424 RepID=A0A428KTN3_9BACT|nr:hypothetical protein [Hymenobacter rigui]RSK49884.1 hypothetical protein EI291_04360 [Hymenobacter rigui]
MKYIYLPFLLLSGLLLTDCSGNDDSPTPANPIAANTASVKVDGAAFPVVMKNTIATLNSSTGELYVNIGTTDVQGASVSFRIVEFRKRAEKITLGAGSPSNLIVTGEYLNSPDGDFSSDRCTSNVRAFQITEFNEKAKTVSGIFSGTVCSTNGKTKTITDGEFNLPYIVR